MQALDAECGSSTCNAALPTPDVGSFERRSALQGQFTLSQREAMQFLRYRLGSSSSSSALAMRMSKKLDLLSLDDETELSVRSRALPPETFMERLVDMTQREIRQWLRQTVHVPGANETEAPRELLVGTIEHASVVEVKRTPTALVWRIEEAFARMAVHSVARLLDCPSFSRTVPVRDPATDSESLARMTWILHPNPLLRGTRVQRSYVRRVRHRRTDSASSVSSNTSSVASSTAFARAPRPIAAGLLQHAPRGLVTPPTSDFDSESSDSDWVEIP